VDEASHKKPEVSKEKHSWAAMRIRNGQRSCVHPQLGTVSRETPTLLPRGGPAGVARELSAYKPGTRRREVRPATFYCASKSAAEEEGREHKD